MARQRKAKLDSEQEDPVAFAQLAMAALEHEHDPEPEPEPEPENDSTMTAAMTPEATPKKTSRKKKPAPVTVYSDLPSAGCTPVGVAYQDDSIHAKNTSGSHELMLKLSAQASFSLVNTTMLDGDFKGYQAIVLKPAPPFPFLSLPPEIRSLVCEYYYSPSELTATSIGYKLEITKTKRGPRAMDFNGIVKHRNAILTLNREINADVVRILYKRKFKFEDTAVMLAFLSSTNTQNLLESVEVTTYRKHMAGACFQLLRANTQLRLVHIAKNIATNQTPQRAAKAFYADAKCLIDSLSRHRPVEEVMDIFRFGKSIQCFSIRDEEGKSRAWTEEEKTEFQDTLLEQAVHFK